MFTLKTQDQRIIELLQTDYLPILIESFLIDRKAQGLSSETIRFYQKKLKYFEKYCEDQAVTQIDQITADLIRRYLLELAETHNPGASITILLTRITETLVLMEYSVNGESKNLPIAMNTTPLTRDSVRYWFTRPVYGRRVVHLYFPKE